MHVTHCKAVTLCRIKTHSTSPRTGDPLQHNFLIPNHDKRQQIAAWCEENGVPVPVAPKLAEVDAPPPAVQPQLQKPVVTCQRHPKEQLRVFCVDCNCAVCVLCAVDVDLCKSHATKAFDPLIEELKTDREGWARAQRECDEGAEQLCAAIQADGDTKIRVYTQTIKAQVVQLQQQVRSAAAARSTAIGAILLKRQEREELVAGAAVSPQVAVKGSAAAAVVASALGRARAPIPPASAAEFRAAAAPAAAVGHVVVAPAVVDPESEAARAAAEAAAAEAASIAAMGDLLGSALLQRVGDRSKVQQFAALMRTKLAGKRYRLLYTWSRDGRNNASFHQRCDNQVRDIKGFLVHWLTLQCRGPRWSLCALPTDSPSAATRLQRGTTSVSPSLLRAASCFGWKTLKAAPPDASTARTRRLRCMVEATARMVHYSMALVRAVLRHL
jgi:hypothetical protein